MYVMIVLVCQHDSVDLQLNFDSRYVSSRHAKIYTRSPFNVNHEVTPRIGNLCTMSRPPPLRTTTVSQEFVKRKDVAVQRLWKNVHRCKKLLTHDISKHYL
jgi:hypothetical protein